MSMRPPILDNPLATAGEIAAAIVALDPDKRPEALDQAERDLYQTALQHGRTPGEGEYFAREICRLIREAIKQLVEARVGLGQSARSRFVLHHRDVRK